MNENTKTFVSFCINNKDFLASRRFTKTNWAIYEMRPDGKKISLIFVVDVTCTGSDRKKIKEAFLALDECPYCRRLIPENDDECTCEYDSVFCDSECQSYYHVFGTKLTKEQGNES